MSKASKFAEMCPPSFTSSAVGAWANEAGSCVIRVAPVSAMPASVAIGSGTALELAEWIIDTFGPEEGK